MRLVRFALRRPITVMVAVLAIVLFSFLAVRRMPVDIFPNLGNPAIYVAQPYGGMDPAQMEGFLTYYFEYHFLYITGIEHVESKSVQGASLMKLVFHQGTDMSQAMAEVVGYVNRSRAFMPPGTVPPFITRFDAGSVAVAQLVFRSGNRPTGEMQDIAINRVRPLFATLEGVSAPPPFGGNQKSIVVRLDPMKLRQYRVSPEEAIAAVNRASVVSPSGNVRIGGLNYIATTNATLSENIGELLDAPVRPGAIPPVYLRDLGTIETGTDIVTGYAHVNGKRTVYIPVTKRADASTLRVIQRVKAALPDMQAAVPGDVSVSLEFDQSAFVSSAIRNLVTEGWLGALLTGLVVLLFLRDWRGALIVITTIPAALFSAVIMLWATGQTINIMTLGGLALAVGILVDEATVEIENIHTHLASGMSRASAVLDACRKTALPRLLAMVSILSVFAPAFFMTGVVRQLFVPLAMAVGFAMIASYLLSSTLVPVLSVWILRAGHGEQGGGRLRAIYNRYVGWVVRFRWPVAAFYTASALLLLWGVSTVIGREVFPASGERVFQLRLRAPTGTRIEKTEQEVLKALRIIEGVAGKQNVAVSTAFIGVQPPSYPINTVHLWTGGPHEGVLKVQLKPDAPLTGDDLKEQLRKAFQRQMPGNRIAFEPGDIIGQVMSFGSPAPIEVAVQGPDLAASRAHAEKLHGELSRLTVLRDLNFAQALDYPVLDVKIDRVKAGMHGLTMADVARSLVAATSSSRFVEPNYWRDPKSGNAFQIQVEIPYQQMDSAAAVGAVPVMKDGAVRPALEDVAAISTSRAMGSVERYNMQRVVSLTANLHGVALGEGAEAVKAAVKKAGDPPKGTKVQFRGQIPPLEATTENLSMGIVLSLSAIFLLLAAAFQSFRVSAVILSTAPAVLAGSAVALAITGATLNVQSFLGTVMATGIAVANAILVCSFAEAARRSGINALDAARQGATGRLRAILMTATAMTAGMIPIALGLGEGGSQTAPLGRAVIGGLVAATIATLTVLPAFYSILMNGVSASSASLDPSDPSSKWYEAS
ncbi:MAG: acriflavin resistance protein [Candidatus Solibacter sp.]|nr:acriflavin resistance protein [Candidatus Solibacter sp.]